MRALSKQQPLREGRRRTKTYPLSSKRIITMSLKPINSKIMMMIFWISMKRQTSLKLRRIQTSIRRRYSKNSKKGSGLKYSKRSLIVYQLSHQDPNKRKKLKESSLIYLFRVNFPRQKIKQKRKVSKNTKKTYLKKQKRKFDFLQVEKCINHNYL